LRASRRRRRGASADGDVPKIAIVGRPNVGKSTLVNTPGRGGARHRLRSAGTTRDSIYVEFAYHGKRYTLIDTAGLRRRGKVFESVEKFSVIKTLQAIDDAMWSSCCSMHGRISPSRTHISRVSSWSAARALVVAVNKWMVWSEDAREMVKRAIARKLKFLQFARFHYISALAREASGDCSASVDAAFRAAFAKLSTPRLTRELQAAIEQQAPPRRGLIRPSRAMRIRAA